MELEGIRRLGVFLLLAWTISGFSGHAAWATWMRSNTQIPLGPGGVFFADIDGDGVAEVGQLDVNGGSRKIYFYHADPSKGGVAHLYLTKPVSKIFVGDFISNQRDQVCVIYTDYSLGCFDYDVSSGTFVLDVAQGGLLKSGDQVIVGHWTPGVGGDSILVYNPTTGSMVFYGLNFVQNGVYGQPFVKPFSPIAYTLGNLASIDLRNKLVFAGTFSTSKSNLADLLLFDTSTGTVARFGAVNSNYTLTFWWSFTTSSGFFNNSSTSVSIANLDGADTDSVIFRNKSTGATTFYKPVYSGGGLQPLTAAVPNWNVGQLPLSSALPIYWVRSVIRPTEPGGYVREDGWQVTTSSPPQVSRYGARWDGANYTYWWAFSHNLPANDYFGAPRIDKWLALRCNISSVSNAGWNVGDVQDALTYLGSQSNVAGIIDSGFVNVYDYYMEATNGRIDIGQSSVYGTYTMNGTTPSSHNGVDWAQPCLQASGKSTFGFKGVFAFLNGGGVEQGTDGALAVDDRTDYTLIEHEIGHAYGLAHAFDDSGITYSQYGAPGEYGDFFGPMGFSDTSLTWAPPYQGQGIYFYPASHNVPTTRQNPTLDAGHMLLLGLVPGTRLVNLTPQYNWQNATITLTAMGRPETAGPMIVKIPYWGDSDPNHFYTIEYRQKKGMDRAIPQDVILVHEVQDAGQGSVLYSKTILLRNADGSEGATVSVPYGNDNLAVSVSSFNDYSQQATVTVTY